MSVPVPGRQRVGQLVDFDGPQHWHATWRGPVCLRRMGLSAGRRRTDPAGAALAGRPRCIASSRRLLKAIMAATRISTGAVKPG